LNKHISVGNTVSKDPCNQHKTSACAKHCGLPPQSFPHSTGPCSFQSHHHPSCYFKAIFPPDQHHQPIPGNSHHFRCKKLY